jgi:hypothetical protein
MANKPKVKKAERKRQFYGIAEWFGYRYLNLSNDRRREFVQTKNTNMPCPFFHDVPALGPQSGNLNCNKAGGVCSLRNFHPPLKPGDDIAFGPITATCPNRFLEKGTIVRHIGSVLLGTEAPLFAKEIPFLKRPKSQAAAEAAAETEAEEDEEIDDEGIVDPGREDVGRIDLVFVHPDDEEKWCAVEMQAVYFSGGAMKRDYEEIMAFGGNGVPMPGAARRPDFRSSGPKRLMPQLMIKVPALRRWGKKMVVVIDKPFLNAMDPMDRVDHISNSDIVWVVVGFDEEHVVGKTVLVIVDTIYTTLESAVTGLTSGRPTTLPEFEEKLAGKLSETLPPAKPPATADEEPASVGSVPMGLPED